MIQSPLVKRALVVAGAATLAVGTLAGCSQIASLGPVSGLPTNTMQIAVDDVLVAKNIKVLRAVECTQSATKDIECKGTTIDHKPIVATGSVPISETHTMAPGGTPTAAANGILDIKMTVKVGGKTIFTGQAQDVVEKSEENRK